MKSKEKYINKRRTKFEVFVNTIKDLQQEVLMLREWVKELEGLFPKTSNNSYKSYIASSAVIQL